jgi:uncharacterized membrane protein YbhN (UPF0104 family)
MSDAEPVPPRPLRRGRTSTVPNLRPLLLSLAVLVAVAVALYVALAQLWDVTRTLERLQHLDAALVACAMSCAWLMYLLRAARWRWYAAAAGHPLPWRTGLAVYLAGQWFVLVRTAGPSRVVMAGHFGIPYGVSIAVALAAGLAEFWGLAALGLAASWWQPGYALATSSLLIATSLVLWALGGKGPLAAAAAKLPLAGSSLARRWRGTAVGLHSDRPGRWLHELARKYRQALDSGRWLLRGEALAVGLTLSLLSALAGAGVVWFAALSLGLDMTFAHSVLVFTLMQVASKPSALPYGLGLLEASGLLLLTAGGLDASLAVAVLLVYRLATISTSMLVGAGGLLTLRWIDIVKHRAA